MQLFRVLLGLNDASDGEAGLRVIPLVHGGFGVYANSVLIAIHDGRADADAHCQRLRNQ